MTQRRRRMKLPLGWYTIVAVLGPGGLCCRGRGRGEMSDKLKACRVLTDFDDDLDDRDSLEMEESCAECQLRLPCPDCATADAEIERLRELAHDGDCKLLRALEDQDRLKAEIERLKAELEQVKEYANALVTLARYFLPICPTTSKKMFARAIEKGKEMRCNATAEIERLTEQVRVLREAVTRAESFCMAVGGYEQGRSMRDTLAATEPGKEPT